MFGEQAGAGGPAGLVVPAAPGVAGRREGTQTPGERGAAAEDRERREEPLQVGPTFIHHSSEGKKQTARVNVRLNVLCVSFGLSTVAQLKNRLVGM